MTELKIRGFPNSFTPADMRDFLLFFEAKSVFVQKDFCIASFNNSNQAQEFMCKLHQKEVLNSRLVITIYERKTEFTETFKPCEKDESTDDPKLDPLMQKLMSINHRLNFNEPPNPNLKYKYPKPNREIIDSICVALESVPKFYTQVLHLMNRMNLPPPFTPLHVLSKTPSYSSTSSQTDVTHLGRKEKLLKDELASDESEIDSDDEVRTKEEIGNIQSKRKAPKMNLQPKKRLNIGMSKVSQTKTLVSDVFETIPAVQKIVVQIPQNLPEGSQIDQEKPQKPERQEEQVLKEREELPQIDFLNKIPLEQMSQLPIFQNYNPGEPSNKLYIKNLAKTVTEEDLIKVYGNFVKKNVDELEIKLMQSGRMKGQAFITFNTPYDEEDAEQGIERMIDKALKATNGLILCDKPMVVVYGKSQK